MVKQNKNRKILTGNQVVTEGLCMYKQIYLILRRNSIISNNSSKEKELWQLFCRKWNTKKIDINRIAFKYIILENGSIFCFLASQKLVSTKYVFLKMTIIEHWSVALICQVIQYVDKMKSLYRSQVMKYKVGKLVMYAIAELGFIFFVIENNLSHILNTSVCLTVEY